jgi:hypothetical protein
MRSPAQPYRLTLVVALLATLTRPSAALASTNSGIDTPLGATELPLAVNGTTGLDISVPADSPAGTVPDVSVPGNVAVTGSIKLGNATIGLACSTEGTLAYDQTNHFPIYCSSTGLWSVVGVVQRIWIDFTGSRSVNTLYTNSTGHDIEVNVTGGCGAWGSIFLWVNNVDAANSEFPTNGSVTFVTATVPNGSTYHVTTSCGGVTHWAEYR